MGSETCAIAQGRTIDAALPDRVCRTLRSCVDAFKIFQCQSIEADYFDISHNLAYDDRQCEMSS